MTELSSCFLSSQKIHLRKMQQLINLLLDIHLFCPHLSNIRRPVYRLFARPSKSSTSTWGRNTSTEGHYNLLSFNCAICFSFRSEQFPSVILPLKIWISVPWLTLTLTLFQSFSYFPALMNQNFVVLTPRALWDHLERKQTTLQTPIFSLPLTHWKFFQLRRRTSHQELPNSQKLFRDEIATYSSITAGIHSQYLFLHDKIPQLEAGYSDAIFWKIPSFKFVFDSAKVARPSSDPLIEPSTSFSCSIYRNQPHG